MSREEREPNPTVIAVTAHGPYRVTGQILIDTVDGEVLSDGGPVYLCRCGGSRNKPWCDATHGLKQFDGTESADHDLRAAPRTEYVTTDGFVISDDRTRCAHFGQCTDRLPRVFRPEAEPFVDPSRAAPERIIDVVSRCPSGALATTVTPGSRAADDHEIPSIAPLEDGPYRVRGTVQVFSADGVPYESRERQTLCRCGQSTNKPFCDGSHFYAEFRDPAPAAAVPSLYDWAGGMSALRKLTERFYTDLLNEPDPILEPIFRGMDPAHPAHVAAWLAETFGGPAEYTADHGGYEHMVAKHRGLNLSEPQRQRWIARMAATADLVDLPTDPDFRSAFTAYLEWGTRIAVVNSAPDAGVIEHAPVPRWGWGESRPYLPQPWDDPDAAACGRQRWADEHPTGRADTP